MKKYLAIKSILGFINLFVIMGLSMFIPAGTFFYYQAWWYLSIFFGAVTIITVYIFINDKNLLQSRLKVGSMAEPRSVQKIIQGLATIGFTGMYIISGLDHRFQWSDLPGWLWVFSDVMVMSSMAFMFIVFRANSFLSATVEVQEQQHVVTTGPYAVVRHPMYLAAILLFIFTPLALGSFWALTTLPLMVLVLVLRSLDEEKALNEQLDGYKEYCMKVRYRIIPYIW
jgi:protein-S-isoprenylcysteine O-methyltransferase Ste14